MQSCTHLSSMRLLFGAGALLICIAGCDNELECTKSAANAENQRFTESLVGNWARTPFEDVPSRLTAVTRKDASSKDYTAKIRDEKGILLGSFTLRLLEIGDYEFIETEFTMPKDAPKEELITIDGKPFQTSFAIWRITKTKDNIQLWEFKDKEILSRLPKAELVRPHAKVDKRTIADCPADLLRKFLLENGSKMTEKAVEFTRYE